jgi:hypothetical protein
MSIQYLIIVFLPQAARKVNKKSTKKILALSVRLSYGAGMKKAKPKLKPLPIRIPLDYAEIIGVDRSHISHVNAGRRPLNREHCYTILEASLTDPRLEGLHILHFRPGDIRSKRWLDVPFPTKKRNGK